MRAPVIAMLGALVASVAVAHAAPVPVEEKTDCEFVEIAASSAKDPAIDAELRPLEKKLKKPPFGSWNVFHQLSRSSHTLPRLKSETLKLKDGTATVLLRELSGSKGARVNLTVTMDDRDGKRVLDTKVIVDAGDYLVIGRSLPNNDGHLLALTCR